ncbi:MAG: hypothetical protein V1797_00545 [Pseudomonadota bacterium]
MFDPQRGYRHLQSGEWVTSPAEAVGEYVEEAPHQRGDWQDLARLVQGFWSSLPQVDPREVEEVRFDG